VYIACPLPPRSLANVIWGKECTGDEKKSSNMHDKGRKRKMQGKLMLK
jgi:hypothetical protein